MRVAKSVEGAEFVGLGVTDRQGGLLAKVAIRLGFDLVFTEGPKAVEFGPCDVGVVFVPGGTTGGSHGTVGRVPPCALCEVSG